MDDGRARPEFDILYKQHVGSEDMFLGLGQMTPSTNDCNYMVVKVRARRSEARRIGMVMPARRVCCVSFHVFWRFPSPISLSPSLSLYSLSPSLPYRNTIFLRSLSHLFLISMCALSAISFTPLLCPLSAISLSPPSHPPLPFYLPLFPRPGATPRGAIQGPRPQRHQAKVHRHVGEAPPEHVPPPPRRPRQRGGQVGRGEEFARGQSANHQERVVARSIWGVLLR